MIWSGAYGYSNLWARTPATPNTVYLIGSTFKAMSTIALLQQMEQGKFKLDDRVNDYLTDFKIQGEDPQHPITFRHLLTHTSGPARRLRSISGLGRHRAASGWTNIFASHSKSTKPPLTSVVYSNMAYTLIGLSGAEVFGRALQAIHSGAHLHAAGDDEYARSSRDRIWKSVCLFPTQSMKRPEAR